MFENLFMYQNINIILIVIICLLVEFLNYL